jgi:hypothetical protein
MGLIDRIGRLFSRKATPVTRPAGSDGVQIFSGYLGSAERSPKLQGDQKWISYDNCVANCISVASAVRVWTALLGSGEWEVEPNPLGGKAAQRCADLVTEGLIDAQMSRPWRRIVRKAGFGATFKGFAMFEQVMRRRSDGRIITADLQHRPQWSIARWDRVDERSAWEGVLQQTRQGGEYYLPRERLLYVVNDDVTDNPDGVGVLRHLIEHARHVERFEQLEGWGFEGDLRGMPLGYAPIKALVAEAVANGVPKEDKAAIKTYVDAQTLFLRQLLEKHTKSPDLSVLLDSEPYADVGEDRKPSAIRKWGLEVVKSQAMGQAEVRAAINAVNREILCCEWMLMGDSEGARSVHEDKTSMFGLVLNSCLEDIGDAATVGPGRRLVALNGFDPDTCTPRVKAAPIPLESIESACRALQLLAQAGDPIRPGDDAPDVLRKRARLPPRPELTPEIEGALPSSGRQKPADPRQAGTPDPDKGEVDIDVSDLEERPAKKRRRAR